MEFQRKWVTPFCWLPSWASQWLFPRDFAHLAQSVDSGLALVDSCSVLDECMTWDRLPSPFRFSLLSFTCGRTYFLLLSASCLL